MKCEEFGTANPRTIVMLHGASFVHTFGKQYPLGKQYHLIVPHLMGFGAETARTFSADACIAELAEMIAGLGRRVLLVGFSLGAQLAFRLVSEHPELFTAAVIVSPWLIKDDLAHVMQVNEKQLASFRNKPLCRMIGLLNGLPRAARQEFVEQLQRVTIDTIRSSVDNGITLDSVPDFAKVTIPVTALAGGREMPAVQESVRQMAQRNPHCRCEIWPKAAHNIPPVFAKEFNALLCEAAESSIL